MAEQQGRVFIHPYDDPEVIAGYGDDDVARLKHGWQKALSRAHGWAE